METRCYVSLSFHYIIVRSMPAPREFYLQNRRNFMPLYYFILCIFLGFLLAGIKDQNQYRMRTSINILTFNKCKKMKQLIEESSTENSDEENNNQVTNAAAGIDWLF